MKLERGKMKVRNESLEVRNLITVEIGEMKVRSSEMKID